MRWILGAWCAAAVAYAKEMVEGMSADTVVVSDHETGFTFTQFSGKYTTSSSILFRVALPPGATATADYDVVVQIVAPREVGWAGIAWGAQMLKGPLTVGWSNGQGGGTVTSRWATSHVQPTSYSGATLQILSTGTHSNYSHWQVTFKCTGCTSWKGSGGQSRLNPKGTNRIAFASCQTPPYQPNSASSSFQVHDVFGYWNHDFGQAANPSFASLVTKNMGSAAAHH